MSQHHLNRVARDLAVEKSLDAAIEIDEIMRGERDASPALVNLVETLVGTRSAPTSFEKKDLLGDSQTRSLYFRAASQESSEGGVGDLDNVLQILLGIHSLGLCRLSSRDLEMIRAFCLGLNRELLSEAFNRTPQSPFARSGKGSLAISHAH